ncbi:hypothetical protein, partial [Acetobacter persici]|uniref:hypothetical protein n=1 Tax=Acetobacter persici TaxID=1076596 RepID=UPI001F20158D
HRPFGKQRPIKELAASNSRFVQQSPTVYNLLGFRAPADYGTYGSYLYNSSWAEKGAIMRSFQFGVNVTL